MSLIFRSLATTLFQSKISVNTIIQIRHSNARTIKPRKRNPFWFVRQKRTVHEDFITADNRSFISEVTQDRYGMPAVIKGVETFPKSVEEDCLLKIKTLEKKEWNLRQRRTGVIARKIGVVPFWQKNGKHIITTMLHVEDNHVIKYYPPREFTPTQKPRVHTLNKFGCLMVGSGSADPSLFTKEYCGLFSDSGVMPKKHLGRFLVTPAAQLLPGTAINVTHFRVGDYVDVRGKTIDRGFQGVMKRWGFKGMPATHGVTKTHRRPGNIGSGGEKARVWPGTKMPGHMGNRFRINRGLKIWRINTEHNVMWVSGHSIPGETNSLVYVYDTMLPLRRKHLKPPFPTCFDEPAENVTDIWAEDCHDFRDPTIFFETD